MNCTKKMITVLLVVSLITCLTFPAFAAPVHKPNLTTKITLESINDLRKNAGLEPLKRDKDLMEAAKIRALESAEKYSTKHMRPNGQAFFSVSTKAWAENTGYGHKTQKESFDSLAKSKGHRANMLDKRMTIVGYACAQGDDGTLYWVQIFGTGKSNYTWAMKDWDVKTFTLDPFNDPKTPMDKK